MGVEGSPLREERVEEKMDPEMRLNTTHFVTWSYNVLRDRLI